MDSIDKLLAALDAIDNPNSTSQADPQKKWPYPSSNNAKSSEIDALLNKVKQDFEQKKVTEVQAEKSQLQQSKIIAQQDQQRKLNRERQAQAWLKNLDPLSGEGLWFMDFARNFASPLEAAMVYLEPPENPEN
jgi:hypothetical protein